MEIKKIDIRERSKAIEFGDRIAYFKIYNCLLYFIFINIINTLPVFEIQLFKQQSENKMLLIVIN